MSQIVITTVDTYGRMQCQNKHAAKGQQKTLTKYRELPRQHGDYRKNQAFGCATYRSKIEYQNAVEAS